MSKQGIVDTSTTLKILQYQIFPINPQGLHTFAVKLPRFGEKFIKKLQVDIANFQNKELLLPLIEP